MAERKFQPGFRLSVLDVGVLIVGGIGAWFVMSLDRWIGVAIVFVVLHFFLFCNVLRMSRRLELIWAGVFVALAIATISWDVLSWPLVFGVSSVVTVIVAGIEMRRPSYHGVGWRKLNPGLLEWWNSRKSVGQRDRREAIGSELLHTGDGIGFPASAWWRGLVILR